MTPLLLTSFTERNYRASGVHLLRSYMRHVHDIPLLVFTEGSILGDRLESHPGISTYDLDTSAFLKDWLQAKHDIIPEDLGGAAVPCNCPQPDDPFGIHKGGCHWAWFNKNASRWFRKIAALHHAASFPAGFDALIWIDSDCRFLRSVSSQDVEDWFAGVSMFYLKGPERQVIESGVIGFQLNQDGRALIEDVVGRYRSGNFRQDARWDDGFQFTLALGRHPRVGTDLARNAVGSGHVIQLSRLGPYISHLKGLHKVAKIMR